jgi:predicted methyltransferase
MMPAHPEVPMDKLRTLYCILLALLLALFGAPAEAKPADPKAYAAALAEPARLAKDRELDARRKPDQLFQFLEVKPGMAVLDVIAGGGYMSEYASHLVGPEGRVTAFNPKAFEGYVKDDVAARYTPGRLSNVTTVWQEMAAFSVPAASFDAAIMVQNYHDVYWVNDKMGWTKVDGPKMLATIKAALKPGGVFGIVDHSAKAGSGTAAAQELHRIEKAAVIKDLQAAGFVHEGESPMFANPADDLSKGVFDPAVRGKTDQFVLRFRKPKG